MVELHPCSAANPFTTSSRAGPHARPFSDCACSRDPSSTSSSIKRSLLTCMNAEKFLERCTPYAIPRKPPEAVWAFLIHSLAQPAQKHSPFGESQMLEHKYFPANLQREHNALKSFGLYTPRSASRVGFPILRDIIDLYLPLRCSGHMGTSSGKTGRQIVSLHSAKCRKGCSKSRCHSVLIPLLLRFEQANEHSEGDGKRSNPLTAL